MFLLCLHHSIGAGGILFSGCPFMRAYMIICWKFV